MSPGRHPQDETRSGHTPFTTRPVSAGDDPFLLALHACAREEELRHLPLDPAQVAAFVRMQHRAQDASYHREHPDASYEILLVGGEPAGRLYVDRTGDEILLLEITLLPRYRGLGIGGAIVQALVDEARRAGRRLALHVDVRNRARALYERAGLRVVSSDGVYHRMELRPAGT